VEELSMDKPTEEEFVNRYVGYVHRKVARDLYRAMYPTVMHTNGPTPVLVEASHLMHLLNGAPTYSQSDAKGNP
jgi:hypothetical protein